MDMIAQASNNSPQLAVDPTEERFVVLANRMDGPDFSCALQASGDGGRGWITLDPVSELPEGVEKCYGPEVGFDARGNLHYLFVGLAGSGNQPVGVYLTTSSDRGQSFDAPRRLLGPQRYQARMAIDPGMGEAGRIHVVWLDVVDDAPLGGLPAPPNPIMAIHSDDGGRTFSEPVQVSDVDRQLVVAPAVAVGRDHQLHVLYYDLGRDLVDYLGLEGGTWQGTWSLVLASSRDGGAGFEPGRVVDDGVAPTERVLLIFTMPPAALAAGDDGNVYVAWHDGRNGDWDVLLRRSADDGRTWGGVRRPVDDPVGSGSHQYLPQIAVTPRGRVDAIFYDRRTNPENRGNDVFYTWSVDHGRTFAPNLRLTRLAFDSEIGARYAVTSALGRAEIGARTALASSDTRVVAAWADTRNLGRAPLAQDIFATQLRFETGGSRPGWAAGAGAALVVGGLATAVLARRRPRERGRAPEAAVPS